MPYDPQFIDEPNFKAFWDGSCKNGKATGIGLDIGTSDLNHVDELTNDIGADERLIVNRDYINKQTFRGKINRISKTYYGIREKIEINEDDLVYRTYFLSYFDFLNFKSYLRFTDSANRLVIDISEVNGVKYNHVHYNHLTPDLITDVWYLSYRGFPDPVYPQMADGIPYRLRFIDGTVKDVMLINGMLNDVKIEDPITYWGAI